MTIDTKEFQALMGNLIDGLHESDDLGVDTPFDVARSKLVAHLVAQLAAARAAGLEEAAQLLLNGSFLHDQSPAKRLAEQAASAIRAIATQAAPTPAPTDHNSQDPNCSCPSGNGSLRWPCLVHPPEVAAPPVSEQDERALLKARTVMQLADEYGSACPAYTVDEVWAILAHSAQAARGSGIRRYSIGQGGIPFFDEQGVWVAYTDYCAASPAPSAAPTVQEFLAEKWAIYYDNLGEQSYKSQFMASWEMYDSKEIAERVIAQWTHAKHYSPVKVRIYSGAAPAQVAHTDEPIAIRAVLLNARAVINKHDTPQWRPEVDIAAFIEQLRKAVDAAESEMIAAPVAPSQANPGPKGTQSAPVESQGAAERDVLAERRRQVEQEGWSPKHDDKYQNEELRDAALCYMRWKDITKPGVAPGAWPWAESWWKPSTDRRNLVKAGALIVAEIERVDRAAHQATAHSEGDAS